MLHESRKDRSKRMREIEGQLETIRARIVAIGKRDYRLSDSFDIATLQSRERLLETQWAELAGRAN